MKVQKTNHFQIKKGKEYITLNELLKITELIPTGGMAKIFLSENKVIVNGESENRRGRKLYHGDRVCVADEVYIID